jgi:hypothetical protein
MTNSESEKSTDAGTQGIDDEQLPEDLRPSEDNPLAASLEERDDARDLDELDMQGGKTPGEGGSEDETGDEGGADDSGSGDPDDSAS